MDIRRYKDCLQFTEWILANKSVGLYVGASVCPSCDSLLWRVDGTCDRDRWIFKQQYSILHYGQEIGTHI